MAKKHIAIGIAVTAALILGVYAWLQSSAMLMGGNGPTFSIEAGESQPGMPGASVVSLEGTTFRLVAYNGAELPQEGNYLVSFMGGAISARFCNNISGSYTVASNIMQSQLMSTKMYCADPPYLMAIENAFGAMLADGAYVAQAANLMSLTSRTGDSLIFEVVAN